MMLGTAGSAATPLRIAVCTDDPVYAEELENHTAAYFADKPVWVQVDLYTGPVSLLENTKDGDVVLLDMDVREFSGLKLGHKLLETHPGAFLICISSSAEYALQGYSLHALQYLLKQELAKAFPLCLDDVLLQLPAFALFVIPTDLGDMTVPLRDILYFEIQNHTVFVHTLNQSRSLQKLRGKLSDLENRLYHAGFLRTHKSYLVNMLHIAKIDYTGIVLKNEIRLPCSRKNLKELQQRYLLWNART